MQQKNIPEIKVIKNNLQKREIEIFLRFLNHPKFPQHRNNIFRAFHELKIKLNEKNNNKTEKEIVQHFINDFYKNNKDKIDLIIKESENLIKEKSKISLKALADSMDYRWKPDIIYIATPTILPFSPYENNIFYFSILDKIYNKDYYDIVFISIHEISHMILADILQKKYQKSINNIMKDSSWYFLKEIMAPVIMNQKQLKRIMGTKDYLGNRLLHYIFISKDNEEFQITEFFQKIYEKLRHEERKSFLEILNYIVDIILIIEDRLEEKRKLWNSYGNKIFRDKNLLDQYQLPIKIKLPGE